MNDVRFPFFLTAATAVLLGLWPSLAASEPPALEPDVTVVRAHLAVTSVRLVDNGDNDGFADPHETVGVYVTLRNGSGSDRNGIVVRMASADSTVACIPTPIVSFGSLLAGEVREAAVPLVLQIGEATRVDPFQDLSVTLDFVISGDGFNSTTYPQEATLDLDLNVSGGFLASSFTEGFEGAGYGSFTTQSLDAGHEGSNASSDGLRCQYNDPDFRNSSSYGNTFCYVGGASPAQNAYDWHVHTAASPDGGRAYLGNNSLHWGVHPGAVTQDTTRLKQIDAIRTTVPVNLGWNGVTSDLSFKHQVGLVDGDYVSAPDNHEAVDRGIVYVELANSAGLGVGHWRKISPYENVYNTYTYQHYSNCLFDPTDDGNTEDDYFDPTDPGRRFGPSSTCYPEFVFSRMGAIAYDSTFNPAHIGYASDGPGLQGSRGPGTWVVSRFSLARWRGRRLRVRFLATSIEVSNASTMQQAMSWNPIEADDGWYIDDVRITNTVTGAATIAVDTVDRSGLPACGPGCSSVSAQLAATPAIVGCGDVFNLDASGSAADECGGPLQFRLWWMGLDLFPSGALSERNAALLQDWNESAILSHAQTEGPMLKYQVDVRCSTHPTCEASTTVVVPVDPSSYASIAFPSTIRFETKDVLSRGDYGAFAALRGDLGVLRASAGNFTGSVETCLATYMIGTSVVDLLVPEPGGGRYYLLREPFDDTQCTVHSWSTGSPAEAPGAGGTRDQDLALDPNSCPGYPP